MGPPLLEDKYTHEDALVVGMMLNSLIRHSDRVRIACLAQLVNVIAPIMTEPGGAAWRQTIFYPFYYASKYGRGKALNLVIDCAVYQNKKYGEVPVIDASAVWNEEAGTLAFFVINRSKETCHDLNLNISGFNISGILLEYELASNDLKTVNSSANPYNIKPVETSNFNVENGLLHGSLKKLSWNIAVVNVTD